MVNINDFMYLDAAKMILDMGVDKPNRTGIDTRSLFALPLRFDLRKGFPLLTTKQMAWNSIVAELRGFIAGVDSAKDFRELGTKIWDANANEEKGWLANPNRKGEDDLGRIYGVQWRHWRSVSGDVESFRRGAHDELAIGEVDQLGTLVWKLRNTPNDRRMIVTAWNPGEQDVVSLPPCHMIFQCYVANGELSLQMTQRSCDWFLGVPFNIASYALLTHMLAQVSCTRPGDLIIMFNDAHIYHNHFDAMRLQITRTGHPAPRLVLNPEVKELWDFTKEDIVLEEYQHDPAIKADMAV